MKLLFYYILSSMIVNNREEQGGLCVVCTITQQKLYEISNCGHRFCRDCCEGFISSQADHFSQAKCLQQGCGAQLDVNKPIYGMLDSTVLQKLQKFKRFRQLQNNPDVRACKTVNCPGFFMRNTAQLRCQTCNISHCSKCDEVIHEGECNLSRKEDEEMGKLNYKRCPKCRIWVQKTAGCEYISCKCGVQFCYRCGNLFSIDPCRLGAIWVTESKVRGMMRKLVFAPVTNLQTLLWTVLRCFLLLTIVFPFTIIYCTVPLFASMAVVLSLVFLFMPLMLFYGVSTEQSIKQKWIIYLILVVTYPLVGALLAIAAFIVIIIFPLARKTAHHGIYDPFQQLMGHMTICYLRVVTLVLLCDWKK